MKLLYFVNELCQKGGIGRIVSEKMNWLSENGHKVCLCLLSGSGQDIVYPLSKNIEVVYADIEMTPGGIFKRASLVFKSVSRIRSIVNKVKPDVVVNANAVLVTWFLPFISRTPLVFESHFSKAGMSAIDKSNHDGLIFRFHQYVRKFIYSKYDAFVVLSETDATEWGLKNCCVIHNFADFGSARLSDLKQKDIIMVGRLERQKRYDLMIDAWSKIASKYPDWKVNVYGEGALREELQAEVDSRSLRNSFIFKGVVDNVMECYSNSSVFCLTSEYEGFCLVALEAMHCGVPVLVFDIPGVCDGYIKDGENGMLSDFGDVDDFANKLSCLIENENLRQKLRDNALAGLSLFDKEKVMSVWIELFNCLTKK